MNSEGFIKIREKVWRKPLARDEKRGVQMDILKIEPGLVDPPHWHDDWEWVYILEGSLEDEKGIHRKGDFVLNQKDTKHEPRSKEGCLAIIVWSGSVRHKQ